MSPPLNELLGINCKINEGRAFPVGGHFANGAEQSNLPSPYFVAPPAVLAFSPLVAKPCAHLPMAASVFKKNALGKTGIVGGDSDCFMVARQIQTLRSSTTDVTHLASVHPFCWHFLC